MNRTISVTDNLKAGRPRTKSRTGKWQRRVVWIGVALMALLLFLAAGGMWFASSQILSPSFRGASKDFSVCKPETANYWGKNCGNLRQTHQFVFSEVQVPSVNGYKLPGWLIKGAKNGMEPARGVIMLVPAGGSDRREETRLISFYLSQRLDVLTFDLSCQGEAPCPGAGLTYGSRESKDVLGAYEYLTDQYEKVYAMGSSIGASSILIALPEMPKLSGVIAENANYNFERLIREAPQAQSMPGWVNGLLIGLAERRGHFDDERSAANSLRIAKSTPVLFIHSKQDQTVSYTQTQDLAALYAGPKVVWIAKAGEHAAIWDVDRADYEERVANFLQGTRE